MREKQKAVLVVVWWPSLEEWHVCHDNYSHVIRVAIQRLWFACVASGDCSQRLCGEKPASDSHHHVIPAHWPSWHYVMMHISTFLTQEAHSRPCTYNVNKTTQTSSFPLRFVCDGERLCGPLVIVIVILVCVSFERNPSIDLSVSLFSGFVYIFLSQLRSVVPIIPLRWAGWRL